MSDNFFKGWFLLISLMAVAIIGVMIWGFVQIVEWLVSK